MAERPLWPSPSEVDADLLAGLLGDDEPTDDARLAARVLLAKLLAGSTCRDIVLRKDVNGAPRLSGSSRLPWVSLSHAADAAAAAVCWEGPVGVDVEAAAGARLAVARRFFHADEWLHLSALQRPEQNWAFARSWTIKEAVGKATTEGVLPHLADWPLLGDAGARDGVQWRVLRVTTQHVLAGAVQWNGPVEWVVHAD